MKDFNTFVNHQRELLSEQKGISNQSAASGSDSSGKIAGMGHGINANTVKVSKPFIDFRNVFTDKVLYNFESLISNMPALDKMVMTSAQKAKLTDTIKKISDVDRRRADILLHRIENVMTLPASADRTKKVQSIIYDINGFEMQLARGSRSYASVQPQAFEYQNNKNLLFGRR